MRTMLPHWWLILIAGTVIMGITASYALIVLSTELLYDIRQKGMVIKYAFFYTSSYIAIIPLSILLTPLNSPILLEIIAYLLETLTVSSLILFYYKNRVYLPQTQ